MLTDHSSRRAGFTLVEIAIVIGIVMVVMVASIRFALPLIQGTRLMETKQKMLKISEALDLYAIQNYRIPCPAIPNTTTTNPFANGFGYEQNNGSSINSTVTATRDASRCGSSATDAPSFRGIVPFKTLGLPESMVKDAWGTYFTYAVSPVFTLPSSIARTSVHARCRTREWVYKSSDGNYRSRNPEKAAFCCPGIANYPINTDLIVLDDFNGTTGNNVLYRNRTGINAFLPATDLIVDSADIPFKLSNTADIKSAIDPDVYMTAEQTPLGVPYVLISHGSNGGVAAFNISNGLRLGTPAVANRCENQNADDTGPLSTLQRTYRDCRQMENTTGTMGYNDDITYWKTQDMMFADQGESCATP